LVVTQEPPAGTVLSTGEHPVVITVRASTGRLVGTCVTMVSVVDGAAARLECPKEIKVACQSPRGAIVTFPEVQAVSGQCGQKFAVTCDPPSGSLFPPGTTLVKCVAVNGKGERLECVFPVQVVCEQVVRRVSFELPSTGGLRLAWDVGGVLETSESVTGPWRAVPNAGPGQDLPTKARSGYFRVRFP
jgi:hypothetical protein